MFQVEWLEAALNELADAWTQADADPGRADNTARKRAFAISFGVRRVVKYIIYSGEAS